MPMFVQAFLAWSRRRPLLALVGSGLVGWLVYWQLTPSPPAVHPVVAKAQTVPGLGAERALTVASGFLERSGFEPVRAAPTKVLLRNCPFQPMAAQAPELVCGINKAFLTGFLDGLGAVSATAVLNPGAGHCCVELRAAKAS